jgi:hypothetical protein
MGGRDAFSLRVFAITVNLALFLDWPNEPAAYAVLAHEAIIDGAWDTSIRMSGQPSEVSQPMAKELQPGGTIAEDFF